MMMTKRAFALLLAVLICAPAVAQNEPSEVSDNEIAKYKALAASSCQDAGTKKGDAKETVDAFCGCLIATISKTMTRVDWQRAYFYSMKGQGEEERQVLAPHLKNVGVCVPQPAEAKPSQDQPAPKPAGTGGLNLKPPR
jgi:hypothetical protein